MRARAAGFAVLLTATMPLACGHTHGPFGYSRHPYTTAQIEWMLGTFPNPGATLTSQMRDTSGAVVEPPSDRRAYATELVAFQSGRPAAIVEGSNPREALGVPDYTTNIREPPHSLSLGNGGFIIMKLVGDPLMDVSGPDIFVFEAGPSRESVSIDISPDGVSWTSVGDLPGGPCALDIGPFVKPDEVFRFVRLRDVENSGGDSDPWPGADIDAVAIVRSKPSPIVVVTQPPQRFTIPTEVLFAFDRDTLGTGAPGELDRVAEMLAARPLSRLSIEGHTDDLGDDDYNLALSERRAQAVKAYLVQRGAAADRIEARGVGESRPVAANDSDGSRQKNRRVEMVLTETP